MIERVDYLHNNVLERFIGWCYELLKPAGKLIFASCSPRGSDDYAFLRWFCDWVFVIRDTNTLNKFITEQMGIDSVNICWEKTKQIFLVIITKNK